MLSRALKMTFWVLHDHIGKLMIVSFIWGSAIALPLSICSPAFFTGNTGAVIFIGLPGVYLGLCCAAPVFGAGIAHLLKVLIDTRDGSLSDFWFGVRTYLFRSLAIGAICGAVLAILGTNTWFYASMLHVPSQLLGFSIATLCIWGMVFTALVAVMALPALVQRKVPAIPTLKLAATLLLANPGLALGVGVQIAFLTCITALIWPFFFIGYGVVVIALVSCTYELLARRYAGTGEIAGASDGQDDYLNRGIRDLFFPWKS